MLVIILTSIATDAATARQTINAAGIEPRNTIEMAIIAIDE